MTARMVSYSAHEKALAMGDTQNLPAVIAEIHEANTKRRFYTLRIDQAGGLFAMRTDGRFRGILVDFQHSFTPGRGTARCPETGPFLSYGCERTNIPVMCGL